jgi:hypothetical protein
MVVMVPLSDSPYLSQICKGREFGAGASFTKAGVAFHELFSPEGMGLMNMCQGRLAGESVVLRMFLKHPVCKKEGGMGDGWNE